MTDTPKMVFVTGYANWGKSETLMELTEGSRHRGWWEIGDTWFFIRRMSNDDRPDDEPPQNYIDFMERLDPAAKPNVIAAFCANLGDDAEREETEPILRRLQAKGYMLYFWVIEHQHGTQDTVPPDIIRRLQTFGNTEVFSEEAEAQQRAQALQRFIETTVTQ